MMNPEAMQRNVWTGDESFLAGILGHAVQPSNSGKTIFSILVGALY